MSPDIYFSFFMFTTDLQLSSPDACQININHIKALHEMGYAGFELPIGKADPNQPYDQEIRAFASFRAQLDAVGLSEVKLATNVGATPACDPSSDDPAIRAAGLAFLKSRVEITAALRGEIMMGPIVVPYGDFPKDAAGQPLWSDALQDHLVGRYANAQPVLNALGEYAVTQNVKLAIEPITHWETPAPNKLAQLLKFLEGVPCTQVGAVIDSAHEVLDGDGPTIFAEQVQQLAAAGRLHYAQVSPPDRGALHTSWIPWESIFTPILQVYDGPIAVEIFNAIPAFVDSLRLTRRKFWIPEVDVPNEYPSAYATAEAALQVTRSELAKILAAQT